MNVKICVPVTGKTREEVLAQAKEIAGTRADIVEWRADFCPALLEAGTLEETLRALKVAIGARELLFTIRTVAQGGAYPYQAKRYERAVCAAIESGAPDLVDLEDSTERESLARLVAKARGCGVRSIASFHNFTFTPDLQALLDKFAQLAETGADILKTAYMPVAPEDVARLMYAGAHFRAVDEGRHELIFMSMGELGKASRVSAGVFGSTVTFASVCGASAPGQLPIDLLEKCLEAFA